MFNKAKFGEAVKAIRGSRSLRAFGEELNISAATLSRIENGNSPDVDSLYKILSYTNWNYTEFLTDKNK